MQPHNFFSTDATPSHSSRKNLILNSKKSPWEHPGGFGIRKSASNSGHSPLRGLGVGLGVGLGDDRGTDRPIAALPCSLPTGHSRLGTRTFDSKLISLLPLDEVPVHVPLRRPRPLRFERLRVPVWNPYSRGRLSPAKSEDRKGGEGKTDGNLTFFFSTCCAFIEKERPAGQAALLAWDVTINPLRWRREEFW